MLSAVRWPSSSMHPSPGSSAMRPTARPPSRRPGVGSVEICPSGVATGWKERTWWRRCYAPAAPPGWKPTKRSRRRRRPRAPAPGRHSLRGRGSDRRRGLPLGCGGCRLDGVGPALSRRRGPPGADHRTRRHRHPQRRGPRRARASRASVVAAADETRRRIERDLHNGTQQRLVSLALDMRAAEASVLHRPAATGARRSSLLLRRVRSAHQRGQARPRLRGASRSPGG
jgi:hypothetical protein